MTDKRHKLVTFKQELQGLEAMTKRIEDKLVKEYETMPLSEVKAFKDDLKRYAKQIKQKKEQIRKIEQ